NDDSFDGFLQLQEWAQGGSFQCLQFVEHRRLAAIMTVRDVLQKQLDLLAGNNVADVVRAAVSTEGQPDHFIARHRWSSAVAWIDGGINLDAQAGYAGVVRRKFNARNN